MNQINQLLACEEIETHASPVASVIWLHGLGANGHDFEPIVPELNMPEGQGVRFVFPHAPSIPVTINNGFVMPAWYDILEMSIDRKVDVEQLVLSSNAIAALIDREIERGIPSERIVLAGFSQGGAVALHCALTYPKPLGGLLALSTYFATHNHVNIHEANQSLAIEVHHGTHDPVVPYALGQNCVGSLTGLNFKPSFKSYPMEHQVCFDQIKDIAAFFVRTLHLS